MPQAVLKSCGIYGELIWNPFHRKSHSCMLSEIMNHLVDLSGIPNGKYLFHLICRFSKLPGINSGSNTNLWYSFDYNLVHFVMLSSEHNYNANSEQLNWLIKDLQNVDRRVTPYIIAVAHKPMYSSNLGHLSDLKFRNAVEHVLIKYKASQQSFAKN
jgi:hypothetical protein